jgi:cyclic pyranopterin phosphate synthase
MYTSLGIISEFFIKTTNRVILNKKDKNIFCARPFYELSMLHDGNVQPCCLLDDYKIGHVKNSTILDLWNNDRMVTLREEFLSGDINICSENIKNKKCHKYYENFEKDIVKMAIQKRPPQKLDLRLNGKCNIECIMCEVWKGPNGVYDHSSFWTEGPKEIFPFLKHIDLLGGEPFVQKDTFRLIDEVSKVNNDCKWAITTNGNWNLTQKIKDYLNKVIIDTITISVDSVFPDTYLRIRKKGDYSQILRNIDDLIQYRDSSPGFILKLDFCVQKMNYLEVFSFIDFCKKKNIEHSFIFLLDPDVFSVLNIEEPKLRDYLNSLESIYKETQDEQLLKIITPVKNKINEL